jgi:hypothetical protein
MASMPAQTDLDFAASAEEGQLNCPTFAFTPILAPLSGLSTELRLQPSPCLRHYPAGVGPAREVGTISLNESHSVEAQIPVCAWPVVRVIASGAKI